MEAGYLALIREDETHAFSAWNKEDKICLVNFAFPTQLWHQIRDQFFNTGTVFFDLKAIEQREYFLDIGDRERIRQLGADLAAGRWTRVNAASFLLGVLALLSNRAPEQEQPNSTPIWLSRAVRQVESWPNFVGGVPTFIKLAGRSHEHVCRDCRRFLNTTPREIVNRSRLKWASMQLETTDMEITNVAHECGFENLGHFYKLFKQTYGDTPRNYQRKRRIANYTQ